MQHELEDLQPQLLEMAKENVAMMQFIDSQSQEMEYNSEVVRAEEVVAKRQAAAAQALKDECEAELAEAVPALEAAIAALNTLKVYYVLHFIFIFYFYILIFLENIFFTVTYCFNSVSFILVLRVCLILASRYFFLFFFLLTYLLTYNKSACDHVVGTLCGHIGS